MCVWNELPGYDTEYTETDRKDIQNLARELETSYARYGKHLMSFCWSSKKSKLKITSAFTPVPRTLSG